MGDCCDSCRKGGACESGCQGASAPQSAGLYALSLGLSKTFSDDHKMLGHGMVMYDALYAWCRSCQAETHNWPPSVAA